MTDEGELLRNQLILCICQAMYHTTGFMHEFEGPIANALLARFDVRLREPQAEKTPQ